MNKETYEKNYGSNRFKKIIKCGVDMTAEYLCNNLERQINKNMTEAEFMDKLTQFEEMLPQKVDNSFWYKKKNKLIRTFKRKRLKNA